jgi:hypothetical protein
MSVQNWYRFYRPIMYNRRVVCYVAKIYDLSVFSNKRSIGKKLRIALERKINFSWFICKSHFLEIKTKLLDAAINLIIYFKKTAGRKKRIKKKSSDMLRRKWEFSEYLILVLVLVLNLNHLLLIFLIINKTLCILKTFYI